MSAALLTGGTRLYRRLEELEANTRGSNEVRVGFLENATYPDGTPVAAVAAWQEFGTQTIPARPFFRNMIKAKSPTWGTVAADLLRQHDMNVPRVLGLMGMGIRGQLQESIIETLSPPLSAVTLMLRKMKAEDPSLVVNGSVVATARARVAAGESTAGVSTKPLVDTGHLLNSVDYQVV